MERFDFASVMLVLDRNITDDSFSNQVEFFNAIFGDVNDGSCYVIDFDSTKVNRWLKGRKRVSPVIVEFYKERANQRKLVSSIKRNIFPLMPDPAMAVRELYDLVIQSNTLTPQKKMELTDGYSFEDEDDMAIFIMEMICLSMQVRFKKRDIREKQLLISGRESPMVVGYIFDTGVPKPCRWFHGRDEELEQLHSLLMDNSKVFVHGIPGIGKSELVKAYAKRYSKEYTNVIYVNYRGDLRQMIIDMDFTDDMPNESSDSRFERHFRFLRSLQEDTLLIIDNFNVTAEQDSVLGDVMKYNCRILFTTRSRYENHASFVVNELSSNQLFKLVDVFYVNTEEHRPEIEMIIELLHGHTFAVELAARLLANSLIDPKELRVKLEKEKAALDAKEQIRTIKDGQNRKATYYDHIHSLFSLYKLTVAEQEIMRNMTLIPVDGVLTRQFAGWMLQQDLNIINDLIELGLIYPKNAYEIQLHPMIREVAIEELKPTVRNCSVLIDSLHAMSLLHGVEFANYKRVFHVVETIMKTIQDDDTASYLLFLENMFQYMDKYRYENGMQAIITKLTEILADKSVGTPMDRACLLDCCAALEKNTHNQIGLLQKAIVTLGEICAGNAHLAANLYTNLGALYHNEGQREKARYHMEQGIFLMEEYGLTGCHDSVIQICNYAALLTEIGGAQRAYTALLQLARKVKEANSDFCMDYGLVQQQLGDIAIVMGNNEQAETHHRKALSAFELVFADEAELLEEKRAEIERSLMISKLKNKYIF